MARSMKQTARAPLSAHQAASGVRVVRGATAPASSEGRPDASPAARDPQSDWPIYAELVAERGDPSA